MKITCLIENLVYRGGLVAEHGLSYHIDTGTHQVILDTGQTGNFINNARRLGVDVSKADALVLSHGHYDHTGGVSAFVQLNHHAPIYLAPAALWPKFNGSKEIGFVYRHLDLRDRLVFVEKTMEIVPGINVVAAAPVVNRADTHWKYFFTEQNNQRVADTFPDELFMAITSGGHLSILSSCSHRGISNVVEEASRVFGLPFNLVAGGFHLKDTQPQALEPVHGMIAKHKPSKLGICHCTGLDHYTSLKLTYPESVFYFHTGCIVHV